MSEKTILVIDDSSTIRRLADSVLSRAGYLVLLAPTAEEGVRLASEVLPDMILLDHQLPGTTGFEVCQSLLASPSTKQLPVVISSTLRKKAYVEYANLANVVDMLPKPYTEDLLVTTVGNVLDTGSLVVASQEQGTAVPEVIDELGESDLAGIFSKFTVREVIDFLNNSRKAGVLEIETGRNRYAIFLDEGRVQGITANGIRSSEITDRLPDALRELAPVLKQTVGGTELDGLVDLLNSNVLDPRLLRRLLRHQAAVLLGTCFTQELTSFRYDSNRRLPPLCARLPLNVSVLALLVESAMTMEESKLPTTTANTRFCRAPLRGQNLDRAGLSAQHSKILGRLTSPKFVTELCDDLGWTTVEVRRVLYGLSLADLVATSEATNAHEVILFDPDLESAERLNQSLKPSLGYRFQVVSDAMAFKLTLKRSKPAAVVVGSTDTVSLAELQAVNSDTSINWIAGGAQVMDGFAAAVEYPFSAPRLISVLDHLFDRNVPPPPLETEGVADEDEDFAASLDERMKALILSQNSEEPSLCQ